FFLSLSRSSLFPYTTLFRSSSILATVLSFFVHQIRAYKYDKKILLCSAIGLTIISIALFMSNQSNVDDPLTGPYDVQFFTYGSRSEEHTSELQSRFDLVCRL